MTYYKKLVGKICYLSPCQIEDAEKWAEWFNDLEVTIPLGDEAYVPHSLENTQEHVRDMLQKQQHVFSIVECQTDRLIGRCLLFNIDQVNRTAMFGIVIGEKSAWNKGYGQEATTLLLDYGFNLLNLHNIMLGVFAFNKRAIQCYQKVGFKEIGRRRQVRMIGGQRFDAILMDLLAEEFQSAYVKPLFATITETTV